MDFQTADRSLAEVVDLAATMPLLAQPGAAWNYSIATDVVGHLVAVLSGQGLGDFLHGRVLAPLGMSDTAFHCPPEKQGRFAANYARGQDGKLALVGRSRDGPLRPAAGGPVRRRRAGVHRRRLPAVLLHDAGRRRPERKRLLGRKTVRADDQQSPAAGDMAAMGQARFSESSYEGSASASASPSCWTRRGRRSSATPGEYAWGGAASTAFWIDPAEDMAVVMLTQLTPSSHLPNP